MASNGETTRSTQNNQQNVSLYPNHVNKGQQTGGQQLQQNTCSNFYVDRNQNLNQNQNINCQQSQLINYNDPQYLQQLRNSREILYSPHPPPPPHLVDHQQQQPQQWDSVSEADPTKTLPPPPANITHEMNIGSFRHQSEGNQLFQLLQGIETRLDSRLTSIESRFTNIEAQLNNQSRSWQNMEKAIQTQNTKIVHIENQMVGMENMKSKVANIQISLDKVEQKASLATNTVIECQDSVEVVSGMFEEAEANRESTNSKIQQLQKDIEKLQAYNRDLEQKQHDHEEKILDLQCRSMRDNLIFFGIDEVNTQNQPENTEETLQKFMNSTLKIENKIEFHRVHRLGRRRRYQLRPRPIIAKFANYKDREMVRFTAPEKLKDTSFGIKEQFPIEIEERRKPLYQQLKKAKSEGKKVKLVKDKLYINDELYTGTPTGNRHTYNRETNNTQKSTSHRSNIRSRVFNRSKNSNSETYNSANREAMLQTPNRFSALAEDQDDRSHQNGKRGANSPLDTEVQTKKHREGSGNYSDHESDNDSQNIVIVHSDPNQTDNEEGQEEREEQQDEEQEPDDNSTQQG